MATTGQVPSCSARTAPQTIVLLLQRASVPYRACPTPRCGLWTDHWLSKTSPAVFSSTAWPGSSSSCLNSK